MILFGLASIITAGFLLVALFIAGAFGSAAIVIVFDLLVFIFLIKAAFRLVFKKKKR